MSSRTKEAVFQFRLGYEERDEFIAFARSRGTTLARLIRELLRAEIAKFQHRKAS